MDTEEKKEVEDTTITSKCKRASATWSRGEVNITINLLRPRFDSIGNQDDARRRNMTIKWIEGGWKEDTNQYNNQPSQMKQSMS
jgi:hypothetical protein